MEPATIFSVDVEDWFHILELSATPDVAQWELLPSHVVKNFGKLLDLFSRYQVNVTCFFLGWVAQRFPEIVRDAAARGHEIACHGYSHMLCSEMTRQAFFQDISRAKAVIEDVVGSPIQGYRAPGFSVTAATPWFFDQVAQAGFTYDSSVFPMRRAHGGLRNSCYTPYVVNTAHGALIEFPISVTDVSGIPLYFFGGGYLRLFPYGLIRRMSRRVIAEGRPVIFYVHPREIEPNHPRMQMNPIRRFKSYVGLRTMESKLRRLLQDFPMTTFANYLSQHRLAEVA